MVKIYRLLAGLGLVMGAACANSSASPGGLNTNGSQNPNGNSGEIGNLGGGNGDIGDASLGNSSSGAATVGTCAAGTQCTSGCMDLPAAPVIDTSTPSDAATHFTATGLGAGGLCIVEPGDGTLLPNNWVRPRFRWVAAQGQSLFEIRLHDNAQVNDLLVYTTNTTWTMPAALWKALAADAFGQDITVTIRGANSSSSSSAPAGAQMKFQIAPAFANGSMIYWAAVGDKNGDSWLEGFSVGDETVEQVLNTQQVASKYSRDVGGNLTTQNQDTNKPLANGNGSTQCIGCHAAAPDKNSVTFLDFYPWPGVSAQVDKGNVGALPSWLTPGGAEALALPWVGMMSFSPAVWAEGQHIVVAGWQVGPNDVPWQGGGTSATSNLVWIDLATAQPQVFVQNGVTSANLNGQNQSFVTANLNKSYGYIARTGDSQGASCPTWSHDGQTVAYVSNNAAKDGRLAQGNADIYTVPYNGNKGGTASPLQGASDSNYAEYYPWYSPDDKYIAYNRAPGSENMYYNPHAEVYVVPSAGGKATRLAANDPPACMGATSPGVTNSWPKWSPQAVQCNGKTYYWLIFSSSRLNQPFNAANFKAGLSIPNEPTSQLYLTAVVDDGAGNLTTYPGVYIWNQPITSLNFAGSNQSNHTPLWDVVSIPTVEVPK